MHLRYPKIVRERVELDPGKRPELIVEEDLCQLTVDVAPACCNRCILLHYKHLFLEHRVVPVSGDAKRAGRQPIQCAPKVGRVRVEPICIDRRSRSSANLPGQKCTCKRHVGEKPSCQWQEHGHIWLRNRWEGFPFIRYICEAIGVEEMVIGILHAVGHQQQIVIVANNRIIERQGKIARLSAQSWLWIDRDRHHHRRGILHLGQSRHVLTLLYAFLWIVIVDRGHYSLEASSFRSKQLKRW